MINSLLSLLAQMLIEASVIHKKKLDIKRYFIKRKTVLVKAMKTYGWNSDIAPFVLNLGTT
jgi:hypothetical protein